MRIDSLNIEGSKITPISGGNPIEITISGFIQNYVIGDWSTSGDSYILDINHNLNKSSVNYEIYDSSDNASVLVDSINVNSNTLRLTVPQTPDGRFNFNITAI